MAYMRGDNYLWSDASGLHLWIADGYDGWDTSGWHREDEGENYAVKPSHVKDGQNAASGVTVAQDVMDEYVLMRFAELGEAGLLQGALERALAKWERAALKRYAPRLRLLLQQTEPPPEL